jgi:hypothetical protein
MAEKRPPLRDNEERLYTGEPLETEDGIEVPQQMPVGEENVEGGGEFPDPNAEPQLPAPGAAEDD